MLRADQSSSIPMARMLVDQGELIELSRFGVMSRRGWLAVFSINPNQDLWPQSQFGRTRRHNRTQSRGLSEVLDGISERLLEIRPEGGRFFVSHEGVFMKDERCSLVQFIRFRGRHH